MALTLKERFSLKRFRLGENNSAEPITLTHRRIFILPTARGMGCALLISIMLLASTVYGNNLGFILSFLLASMVVVSILHSFRSLAGLRFSSRQCQPVFTGEKAIFNCQIANPTPAPRLSVWLRAKNVPPLEFDVESHRFHHAQLLIPTVKRGWYRIGTVTLFSYFPLGLFRAWSPINLDQHILIYPSPASDSLPFPMCYQPTADFGQERKGDDDFAGFQQYYPGDSLKQIYWKAVAKEQGFHTKQYDGDQTSMVWLDWAQTPGDSIEQRLSRLCRWVLDAEQSVSSYGLRLPSVTINPCSGDAHRSRCLKELALFGHDDPR